MRQNVEIFTDDILAKGAEARIQIRNIPVDHVGGQPAQDLLAVEEDLPRLALEDADPLLRVEVRREDAVVEPRSRLRAIPLGGARRRQGEQEEGAFYVWTMAEVDGLLGEERAAAFKRHYNFTPAGNFEKGLNVLHSTQSIAETAAELEMSDDGKVEGDVASVPVV